MKAFTGIAVLTVGCLVGEVDTASAAWNNVFQASCRSCRSNTSYYAPAPSCDPCPAPCPTISYRQRCCYQPYTAYRQQTVMEPVTTYKTSYYWDPVTTYRYTSYYDPCTGCCQQVATPCTSYRLRSQCNACQSYVQRCQMVPYTAYRQSCYMEPVVTYAPPACPTPCPTPCPTSPIGAGVQEGVQSQPGLPDIDRRPLPGVSEGPDRTLPPQNIPNNRRVTPSESKSPTRMDRIASNSNGRLQGMVVSDDRITPKGGARITFASGSKRDTQFSAQADSTGRFAVELPAGEWDLYMTARDGKPVFHSQIVVKNNDQRLVTVVSR